MAPSKRHTVIIGTGSSIPPKVVPNSAFLDNEFFMDYGQPVEPGTNEKVIDKFQQITDIGERRHPVSTIDEVLKLALTEMPEPLPPVVEAKKSSGKKVSDPVTTH